MSKYVFITKGSRGDVQPCMVIGLALQKTGCKVTIATHKTFKEWIEKSGLLFSEIPGEPDHFVQSAEGQRMLNAGQTTKFVEELLNMLPFDGKKVEEACQDADFLVGGTMCWEETYTMSEKLKKPLVNMAMMPLIRSGEFPSPILTTRFAFLNKITFDLVNTVWWQRRKREINTWRVHLGLKPIPNFIGLPPLMEILQIPHLFPISPYILPRPKDWHARNVMGGYLYCPAEVEGPVPSEELQAFVDQDPKPFYLGFGSMAPVELGRIINVVGTVVARSGRRAVVCSGWGRVPSDFPVPPGVMLIPSARHSWLFPRCSAIIHHGGAGTTASAFKSGVPCVICPVTADQQFWGEMAHRVGVAPKPLPLHSINADALLAALEYAWSPRAVGLAGSLGQRLTAEAGPDGGAHHVAQELHRLLTDRPVIVQDVAQYSNLSTFNLLYPNAKFIFTFIFLTLAALIFKLLF